MSPSAEPPWTGTPVIRHDRRMPVEERPLVVAVCGSPGAGKTTVARATALRLGVPLLTRDEFKLGLALSTASAAEDGSVRLGPGFHIAGGPLSARAETAMVATARLLAAAGAGFVVESSVLSHDLLDALDEGDARVLAVHVVARDDVVEARLRARTDGGGEVDRHLLAQFLRGEMTPALFAPPARAGAALEIDTSTGGEPDTGRVLAAALALLR